MSADYNFENALNIIRSYVVQKGKQLLLNEMKNTQHIDTRYIRIVEIIRCCAQSQNLREELYYAGIVKMILEGLARCENKILNVLLSTIELFCSTEGLQGAIFRDLLIGLKKWVKSVGIEVVAKELLEYEEVYEGEELETERAGENRKRMQSKIGM